METSLSLKDDLLNVAAYYARDAQDLCSDVSAMAFPSGYMAPSEEMLASVASKMRALISGIENSITGATDQSQIAHPQSWKLLSSSGFLREAGLVDFILARFAEDRLNARIASQSEVPLLEQLPARLLSDSDPVIAEAAQTILMSEAAARRSPRSLYRQLSPEILHQLVWRIVAALQIVSGARNDDHTQAAKSLLSMHEELQTGRVAARKIIHFTGVTLGDQAMDPQQAGLAIFIAAVSSRTGLDQDHILRLSDGHSSTPLAVILRACSIDRDAAMAVICLFKRFTLTPYEITLFNNSYNELSIENAQIAIDGWCTDRLQYISFPDLTIAAGK